MVDTATLIVVATLVQTLVLTFTLFVFIFQFRSQEKAVKESSYQNLMGRYNDFIMMMTGRPELVGLLIQRSSQYKTGTMVTPEDASIYGHLLVAYGIIEEAFLLYQKGWIDKDTWDQWDAWLKALCAQPQFRDIRTATAGTFDSRFEKHITDLLTEK